MAINEETIFETLNKVNVSEHIEKKGRFNYLSWPWAWAEVKKRYPAAEWTVYQADNGVPYITDGRYCWVKVGVKIGMIENVEIYPVTDNTNKSIPVAKVTSFEINTAIQRAMVKAIARHGLGLYIYAGEDLPEEEKPEEKPLNQMSNDDFNALVNDEKKKDDVYICSECGTQIVGTNTITAKTIAEGTLKSYGRILCQRCGVKEKKARAEAAKNAG